MKHESDRIRFSLAFFLSAAVWLSLLFIALAQTMRLSQVYAEQPAKAVAFLTLLLLAYAFIGWFNDKDDSKPYWSGFVISSVLLLVYFQVLMPNKRNQHLLWVLAEWIFTKHRDATGVPAGTVSSYTYVSSITAILAYWLIPVFSHVGGVLGVRFARRRRG